MKRQTNEGDISGLEKVLIFITGLSYLSSESLLGVSTNYFLVASLKTLPIFCLLFAIRNASGYYAKWIKIALFLSAVADFVIEKPSQFLPGVAVFMLVHLSFIKALLPSFQLINRFKITIILILWALFVISFTYDLKDKILQSGIYVYIVIIHSMIFISFNQLQNSKNQLFLSQIKRASIYFGISDTLIAIRKFLIPPFLLQYFNCSPSSPFCFEFQSFSITYFHIIFFVHLLIILLYWYSQLLFSQSTFLYQFHFATSPQKRNK